MDGGGTYFACVQYKTGCPTKFYTAAFLLPYALPWDTSGPMHHKSFMAGANHFRDLSLPNGQGIKQLYLEHPVVAWCGGDGRVRNDSRCEIDNILAACTIYSDAIYSGHGQYIRREIDTGY